MFKNFLRIFFISLVIILASFYIVKANSLNFIEFTDPAQTVFPDSGNYINAVEYTGNASTANLLLNSGQNCAPGEYSTGINSSGNAICEELTVGNMDTLSINYIPKWDGTTFQNSVLYDNGTYIGIGTELPETNLQIGDKSGSQQFSLFGPNSNSASSEILFIDGSGGTPYYNGMGIRYNSSLNRISIDDNYNSVNNSLFIVQRDNGFVGISSSTPTALLSIGGMARNGIDTFTHKKDLVNKGYVDSAIDALDDFVVDPGSTDSFGYWNLIGGRISNKTLAHSIGVNTSGTDGLDNVSFAVAQGYTGTGKIKVESTDLNKIIGCFGTNFSNSFKVGDTIKPTNQATTTITWISPDSEEMLVDSDYTSSFGCTTYNLTSVPAGGAPRFVVKGSGSVGINIMDPQASLHISSSATNASSSDAILVADASSTAAFKVDREGKVTIGSSTSNELLNIGDGKIFLGSTSTSTEVESLLYNVEGQLYWGETLIGSASSNPWRLTNETIHASSSEWKVAIGSSTEALEALHLDGKMYLGDSTEAPVDPLNRLYSLEGKLYWGDSPVGSDATTTWALDGNNLYSSSTDWNVAIGGVDAGAYKLNVTGDAYVDNKLYLGESISLGNNIAGSPIEITKTAANSIEIPAPLYADRFLLTSGTAPEAIDSSRNFYPNYTYSDIGSAASPAYTFAGANNVGIFNAGIGTGNYLGFSTAGNSRLAINYYGRIGLGTTAIDITASLDINRGEDYAILTNGKRIAELPEQATFNTEAASKKYVDDQLTTAAYLPLSGGAMTGSIDMGSNNITGINEITANKLNVNVIDPLYTINGVNYATFGASFAGGLKEEYSGKATIENRKRGEYEHVVDFDNLPVGSDLWLWRQVVDFSKDNVEVIITPYGSFADVYYVIKDNKIIFKSDKKTEISYRLTGRRFDWKKWPTITKNQNKKGMIIK